MKCQNLLKMNKRSRWCI